MASAFNCPTHAALCSWTPFDRSQGAGGSRPYLQAYSVFIYKPEAIENDGTTPGLWVYNRVADGYGPAGIINSYESQGWCVGCLVPVPYQADEAFETQITEARAKGKI